MCQFLGRCATPFFPKNTLKWTKTRENLAGPAARRRRFARGIQEEIQEDFPYLDLFRTYLDLFGLSSSNMFKLS